MRQILHISDVHFGPPHLSELSAGVLAFIEDLEPDLVVISGDLTQRAKPRQFQEARQFVDQIPVRSLVVPGNHDVPLYRVWERFLNPYGAYRRHFSEELEPVYRDDELLVVGINTAHGWTFKDGRIRLRRLLEVAQVLEEAPPGVLKVVVAHHHLIPPPWFGTQRVLTNAYEAMELFTSVGVDLVLSGHLHQSFIGNSEEFYPQGVAEFREMMTANRIALPRGVTRDLTPGQVETMVDVSLVLEPLWENALGTGWREVATREKIRSLYARM